MGIQQGDALRLRTNAPEFLCRRETLRFIGGPESRRNLSSWFRSQALLLLAGYLLQLVVLVVCEYDCVFVFVFVLPGRVSGICCLVGTGLVCEEKDFFVFVKMFLFIFFLV